ncbi:hypothetical protein IMZ48_30515, partial [Candidatus Bathyarchaeota archaeon]|nr:hypothetical protein [Candidatus Bathyarchaeota archaeon]
MSRFMRGALVRAFVLITFVVVVLLTLFSLSDSLREAVKQGPAVVAGALNRPAGHVGIAVPDETPEGAGDDETPQSAEDETPQNLGDEETDVGDGQPPDTPALDSDDSPTPPSEDVNDANDDDDDDSDDSDLEPCESYSAYARTPHEPLSEGKFALPYQRPPP